MITIDKTINKTKTLETLIQAHIDTLKGLCEGETFYVTDESSTEMRDMLGLLSVYTKHYYFESTLSSIGVPIRTIKKIRGQEVPTVSSCTVLNALHKIERCLQETKEKPDACGIR